MAEEIFISYARRDQERAEPLVSMLKEGGFSVWMDKGNIEAARLWSEQIVQAIKECRTLILLVSRNSLDSDNVLKEVMLASESEKKILPVYLEPCDLPDRFRYQLAGIQHIEFYDLDSTRVREKICTSLKSETEGFGASRANGFPPGSWGMKELKKGLQNIGFAIIVMGTLGIIFSFSALPMLAPSLVLWILGIGIATLGKLIN